MKIGIGLPDQVPNVSADVIPEWARSAEGAGFSSLGTVGRIAFPGVMDTVARAAAAGATSRIGLISNVLLAPVWPAGLLAKGVASIDGVSGGRLTLGLGLGGRPDDFVAEGRGPKGLGKRFDADLETYHKVWRGELVDGMQNPAVPSRTRGVPLLFGGFAPQAFARMVRYGKGYVAASVPPPMAAAGFEQARTAWKEAGREGEPRLVAIAYFGLGNPDRARAGIHAYYSFAGEQFGDAMAGAVLASPDAVEDAVKAFADIGADELVLNPGADDPDEVKRLADVVL